MENSNNFKKEKCKRKTMANLEIKEVEVKVEVDVEVNETHFKWNCFKKMKRKDGRRKKNVFKMFGFYLTILIIIANAIGLFILWCTNIYDNAILEYLTIKDGGTFYKIWRDPKTKLTVRVYPFNYTNIEAVIAGTEKPKVQEVGPYVFREYSTRTNVKFHGIETVSYSFNRTYTFLRDQTNGTLNDTIITPNVVFIAATDKVSKDAFKQISLNLILALFKSKPFIKVSLYEFIMGYDDNFSTMLRNINSLFRKEVHPPFGILKKRTGLSEDVVTIGTGVPNLDHFGIIKKFNEKEYLNYWKGSECNNITASDGFLFPGSAVSNSDVVYAFAKDLCRRTPLKFEKEFQDEKGFIVRRFSVHKDIYSSPDVNPDNACFCSKTCQISGIQDVSPCFYDAPFFMSQPHFLHGDKKIFEMIDGLHPDPEKHTYFVDLHPIFGIPLKSVTRVQLGMIINKGTFLSRYKSMSNGSFLPISWMDFELDELPDDVMSLLYHGTFTAPILKSAMKWSFLFIFIFSFIKFCSYLYLNK